MAIDESRPFDIVLWGATGFTGCLVANYLARQAGNADLRWAIAGRNRDKLEDLRRGLGPDFEDLPILVGDALDRASMDEIAQKTRVVCTTVGPYAHFGSNLVAACVEARTDYCDLTGEVQWVREMIDKYHDEAVQRGVRIVHCCGFDSIPSDLGTWHLQTEAQSRYGTRCDRVDLLVWKIRGGVSGGTVASMTQVLEEAGRDRDVRRCLADPYGLNPPEQRSGPDDSFQRTPRIHSELGAWTGPFIMAAINEKVVRRTNALLDYPYGDDFRYSEASHLGTGVPAAVRATAMSAGLGAFSAAMALRPTRALLERFLLPSPGEGPSQETIEDGHFSLRLFGWGRDDQDKSFRIVVEVSADSDPGYGATSTMLGESALCLAVDEVDTGLDGGVLTPASALGDALVERLHAAGISFNVLE